MIRMGAMLSSWLGQRLELPPHRLKILVGCGAAAGLAATYNIPIGGTLFAMEVILGNFALEIFGPIVASSVIATLIARSITGNAPLYAAPEYALSSGWEMLLYAGLGIAGAFASVLFMRGVSLGGKAFARLRFLPRPLHPLIGMTLLGVIGLYVPHALGRGVRHDQPGARRHAAAPRALRPLPGADRPAPARHRPGQAGGDRPDPGVRRRRRDVHPLARLRRPGGRRLRLVHARALAAHRLPLRRLRRRGHGGGDGGDELRADQRHPHPLRVHRQLRPDPAGDAGRDPVEPARPRPPPLLDLHRVAARQGDRPARWRRRCSPASRRRA